jgi:hypothetical protein
MKRLWAASIHPSHECGVPYPQVIQCLIASYYSLGVSIAIWPSLVAAHSWYPHRCRHHMDCYPVDTVRRLSDGTLVLSRGAMRVRAGVTTLSD